MAHCVRGRKTVISCHAKLSGDLDPASGPEPATDSPDVLAAAAAQEAALPQRHVAPRGDLIGVQRVRVRRLCQDHLPHGDG